MSGLTFDESSHKYQLDGKDIPSVTTLLNALPQPWMKPWVVNTIADWCVGNPDEVYRRATYTADDEPSLRQFFQGLPDALRDMAGTRGTAVHEIAERLLVEPEVEVPQELAGYAQSAANFLNDWRITPQVVERPLVNRRYWYAGKPDLLGPLPDGRMALVDYKTAAKGIKKDKDGLQQVGYANAEFYIDESGNEIPMPHVDLSLLVHLTPSGYKAYEVAITPAAFDLFLSVAELSNGIKTINSLVGKALPVPAWKGANA